MAPAVLALPPESVPQGATPALKPLSVAANAISDTSFENEHAELLDGLKSSPKQIPCSFLYDEKGSDLYNQITELDEYYPYRVELAMFHEHAADIITHIPKGAVVVELGCGSAQKTAVLLRALLARDGPEACRFVGIDVSGDFLQQAKANLLGACPELLTDKVELVQASYLDGLKEARAMHPDAVLCVLWLGSSVGNLDRADTLAFFKDMLCIGGPRTEVLVCTDLWKDQKVLHAAYCDSLGVTEAFIKNGMANAVAIASHWRVQMNEAKWTYDVLVNDKEQQVEMWLVAGESLDLGNGIHIRNGERILIEVSRKFTTEQLRSLAYRSGFFFQAQWRSAQYSMQLLCAPSLAFTLAWRDTDDLYARLHDWHNSPIELRHPFCFYYGHVVSFAKIKMLKNEALNEWDTMFSRGIDPDVSDPSKCHSHPDAPSEWPAKGEIVNYTSQVRQRLMEALDAGQCSMRTISISLEHERMHQETLCYMMAQHQKHAWEKAHLLGGGGVLENGAAFEESMARWSSGISANEAGSDSSSQHPNSHSWTSPSDTPNNSSSDGGLSAGEWVRVPAGNVVLGTDVDPKASFVWDIEGPRQAPQPVQSFQARSLPVSIAEFRDFLINERGYVTAKFWDAADFAVMQASKQACPSTWTVTEEGDVWVHYPEGTWNWREVADRPVWCSLAEARAFATARCCRIVTEAEYVHALGADPAGKQVQMLEQGGWEWTASELQPLQGYAPMEDYPEYSADFFDGKHFVLKGSSPYTHSSLCRTSFRNFYQGVYPHMFAKFRCCR